jgi:cytochrome c-type biogenesis protein CcmH/NrfG
MHKESVFFGLAGVFFGLLAGWIIGSQQAPGARTAAAVAPASSAAPASAPGTAAAPPLDEARVSTLKATAERNPSDAETRVQLGNVYFDAERYADAIQWYEAALKVDPRNINASTDLGIAFYYTNKPDLALAQFEKSLAIDPRHSKTLLNVGIVRAFGKEDLDGAAQAWQKVIELAPDSPEAAVAKKGLDGMRSGHAATPGAPVAKSPGSSN